jgi:fermentation-respiration switch protein FrsA (DUF1100 family)
VRQRVVHAIITSVIVFYVVLVLLGLFSDRLIFQPQSPSYSDSVLLSSAARLGVAAPQVVHFQSSAYNDGRKKTKAESVTGLYLPNPGARYTILFSHGNAEDLGDDLPLLDIYRRAGFSVFAYDYRGYGTSTGQPTEAGLYADAEAAYNYLTGELHVAPRDIIVMGRSLGCAAALQMAVTHPSAGLVLEAPFQTAFKVLTRVRLLPFDKFDNESRIRQYRGPLLVIQGISDEVVPLRHGQRIFAIASGPKQSLWVPGAHHNDVLFTATQKYLDALHSFAATLG